MTVTKTETTQPIVPGQQRAKIGRREGTGPRDARPPRERERGRERHRNAGGSTTPSADNRRTLASDRTRVRRGGPIDATASVRSAASRGSRESTGRTSAVKSRTSEDVGDDRLCRRHGASMRPAMRTAKGVVLRSSCATVTNTAIRFPSSPTFAGNMTASCSRQPTASRWPPATLKDLPSGDRTPLPADLETWDASSKRSADTEASVVVLVTDGRANVADGSPTEATRTAARALAAGDLE